MLRRRRREDGPEAEIVELAALADGSLPPGRRAVLEARVAASSELAERLDEQHPVLSHHGIVVIHCWFGDKLIRTVVSPDRHTIYIVGDGARGGSPCLQSGASRFVRSRPSP